MVCLYLMIPENLEHLILQDKLQVVHIPYVCMISIPCTIPSGSSSQASHVFSCTIFWTNLLHSLIIWLIVSSLSPHNLHLLFYYIWSIFALTEFILMALFCATIQRDSLSLLRFPFLLVSCLLLEISLQLFFFPFLLPSIVVLLIFMLLELFLVAVINLSWFFFMLSLNHLITASMLSSMPVSFPPPPFLNKYNLSLSSLGCKALCIIISFLVFWSICGSSYFIHFKNYYYYYFTPSKFFTPVLTGGFSLDSEWQQVYSSL